MNQFLKPIHFVCEENQYQPNYALIEIENNFATCSNGCVLFRYQLMDSALKPEQIAILNGKFIHMNAWKEIWKCDELDFDDEFIYCSKDSIKTRFEYAQPQGTLFGFDSIITELPGQTPTEMIGITSKIMTALIKAFDCTQLTLSFSGNDQKGIAVYSAEEGQTSYAVLMPVALNSTSRMKLAL